MYVCVARITHELIRQSYSIHHLKLGIWRGKLNDIGNDLGGSSQRQECVRAAGMKTRSCEQKQVTKLHTEADKFGSDRFYVVPG